MPHTQPIPGPPAHLYHLREKETGLRGIYEGHSHGALVTQRRWDLITGLRNFPSPHPSPHQSPFCIITGNYSYENCTAQTLFVKSLGKPKENGGNKTRTPEDIPASAADCHSTRSTEPNSQPDKHNPPIYLLLSSGGSWLALNKNYRVC